MKTTRIFLVEDHPIVRQGYTQFINTVEGLEVAGFAETQQEALQQIKKTSPHLAIIDISLKEGNGLELIKQLHQRCPKVKMLVSSAQDEKLYAERVLLAGALGFVSKQEATEKLLDAIQCVISGEVYVSEAVTRRILKKGANGASREADPMKELSDRELEAFNLIGQGLNTAQVADEMHVSSKTAERYKENIKCKLNLANATELLQRATQWRLEKGSG